MPSSIPEQFPEQCPESTDALSPSRAWPLLSGLGVLLAGLVLLRYLAGPDGFGWPPSDIIAELRLGRVIAAITVGAALAIGGVFLQSLLRNPLASPDLLGLSAGAGLGVTIAAFVGFQLGHGLTPSVWITPAALVGSLAVLGVVYAFSRRRWMLDPVTLILVGVVVAILCGAMTSLLRHLLPDQGLAASRLLLGSIRDDVPTGLLLSIVALTAASLALGMRFASNLDAAGMSDDEARSVGVPLNALRIGLFILSGMLAAGSVLLAGVIGFVGLVCPHLVRLLAGPTHRVLLPGAALAGGVMVVGGDLAVRLIDLNTGRLPLGVLTALIGGPVLIVLLRSERSARGPAAP